MANRLMQWYERDYRALPWRAAPGNLPEPYHVLVSEAMLQQTQVGTVIGYFNRFIEQFPTVRSLAEADEQRVLLLWQGLGYYARARNLHRAAEQIMQEFGGTIPRQPAELLKLPGIGRYTAGAIASIGYGICAPIVDGNVARILCRLNLIERDPRDRRTAEQLWEIAELLVPPKRAGDFNSALMELGQTICMPRNPNCKVCPIQKHCQAYAGNRQQSIPVVRDKQPLPLERRCTLCVERRGKWLIEQRPATGRWAGLWQFPTFPAPAKSAESNQTGWRHLTTLGQTLTHRRYEFEVYQCVASCEQAVSLLEFHKSKTARRKWVKIRDLSNYPMSKSQAAIGRLVVTNAAHFGVAT